MTTPAAPDRVLHVLATDIAELFPDDSVALGELLLRAKSFGLNVSSDEARQALAEARRNPAKLTRTLLEPEDAAPLFDLEAARFGRFFMSTPPERRMLTEMMPLDVTGLLASGGGVGKSLLLNQLGISIATGLPFLGMPVEEVGSVLLLMAEDDEPELHRRGLDILAHYERQGPVDRGALSERLHIVSRVADDNMLTAGREGEVVRTRLVDQLITAAQQIPDLKFIGIDPASRFKGGNANAEADATKYVEVMEAIRAATGAMVLSSIHVNKSSLRDNGDADQAIVRGSTALVDGVRWVGTMQTLRRDQAKDFGVAAEDAKRYVRFDVVKSNYTRPWSGMWLYREAGGVLVPTTLETSKEAKAEETYHEVVDRLKDLLLRDGPMSSHRIQTSYAGKHGTLGIGLHAARSIIARAVTEGELIELPGRQGGKLIAIPGLEEAA